MRGAGARDSDRRARPLEIPDWPLDILAQQIVAACGLRGLGRRRAVRARPARLSVPRAPAAETSTPSSRCCPKASRRDAAVSGALLHRDRVNGVVRGRRGARLAAITSGGAIPDNAQLPGRRRARRRDRRHARRRFRGREPRGRRVPAGHALLADPPRRSGPRARRGCARRGAVDSVLARRSARPHRRAVAARCRRIASSESLDAIDPEASVAWLDARVRSRSRGRRTGARLCARRRRRRSARCRRTTPSSPSGSSTKAAACSS